MFPEMLLVLFFLNKESPALVQARVTLLARNLLSLKPEICVDA
jgi:hypothetical protein